MSSVLHRAGVLMALCAMSLSTAIACGGGDSANDDLVEQLVAEGATEEQARCFVDELGDDADRLMEADEDEISDEDAEKLIAALPCLFE